MAPQLPDISDDQHAVLERIYAAFRDGSPWPRFADLDREFDRKGIDLAQVLRATPLAYIFLDRNRLIDPGPDMELQLSLFGIAGCPGSENDLALFFVALRWLVTVEVEHVIDPSDPSTVEVFATAAGFNEHLSSTPWEASPSNVRKVGMLLKNEPPGVWQSFGGGDDWRASLRRGVRKYRNVATLDDYLSIVAEAAPQLYGLGPSYSPAGRIPSAGGMPQAS